MLASGLKSVPLTTLNKTFSLSYVSLSFRSSLFGIPCSFNERLISLLLKMFSCDMPYANIFSVHNIIKNEGYVRIRFYFGKRINGDLRLTNYLAMHSLNCLLWFFLRSITNESKSSWSVCYFVHHQIDCKIEDTYMVFRNS